MFIVETLFSVLLIQTPPLRKAEDAMIQFDSVDNRCIVSQEEEKVMEPITLLGDSIQEALAKDFGAIPQVKHILTESVPTALLVWIAVDDPEPHIRHRIYDKELGLISEFPNIDFEFNLVSSLGRSASDIATGCAVAYSRPD